jgi:hypothetical protein
MPLKEYDVVDDPLSGAGQQLTAMAKRYPQKTSRLLDAVDEFIDDDGLSGTRMATSSNRDEEVYLAPPASVLSHIPDAAALIHLDHPRKRIECVEIFYPDCGGPGYDWNPILAAARTAIKHP